MKFQKRLISVSFFAVLLVLTALASWAQNAPPQGSAAPAQSVGPTEQDIPPGSTAPNNLAPAPDNAAPAPDNAASQSGEQIPEEGNPANDPSGRVGRLQYMSGSVSVQPHGTDDWVEGSANRPLTNADNIWADKDSRAEIGLGTGLLRINSESSLTLTNVTNDAVQVSLHQGALNVHIRHLYSGEVYEIDTPNLAFTVRKSGDYRFDVDPNGDTTTVTVWKGEGEATGQGPAVTVHGGEQAQFSGGTSLAHQIHAVEKPDGFDDWCRVRDQREDHSVSAKYVAPGVVGTEDLDDNGTWRNTPDYGNVWVPNGVAPGWAPYSAGNWMWEDPWGWTWVDAYPWGFAPFHYGRWVSFGGYWGWAPGPYWVRPWYAPALVGWFGGPRFGIGFGFGWGFGGGFGWCPLGWGEPFYPWYRTSRGYFRNVNISNTHITNITHITNNYYNHGVTNFGARNGALPRYASTAGRTMSRSNFASGRPVAANSVRLSATNLKGASSLSRPNASPTSQARLGANARPAATRPLGAAFSRPTVSRMTPPASSSRMNGTQAGAARNTGGPAARNGATAPNRGNETRPGATSSSASGGRYVPRPPQSAGGSSNSARTSMPSTPSRSVPRPPENGSVNRPEANGRNSVPSGNAEPRSYGVSNPARNVPRPSGPVRPAPRGYSSESSRGEYSARAYGGDSSRSYGGNRGYRGYSERPTYDSPNSGRSNGGGRSYSAPSHSSGSGGYHGSSGSHASSGGHASSAGHSGGGGHGGRGR